MRLRRSGRPLYARLDYASAFGFEAVDIEAWGTGALLRPIPGGGLKDVLGCYPLAAIAGDAELEDGLEALRATGAVAVTLVPDPVGGPAPEVLARAFEICRPFKTHYLIDPGQPARLSASHRRWVRKAQGDCRIEAQPLAQVLAPWTRLYAGLVRRHGIGGLQDFPPSYFAALAAAPEVTALVASHDGEPVAMSLWVEEPDVAYYHLGASSELGYRLHAAYGLMAAALEMFGAGRILHLGGAAGLADDPGDGLAQFKRGFSNRRLTAYLCGARLDPARYAALAGGRSDADYFPAYRRP
jgi:hypothetical protein